MGTLFFIASKLIWALIKPETWIALGLGWALLAALRMEPRRARRRLTATLVLVLVIGFVPLGHLLLTRLESRYPVDPPLPRVDGIVILGGGEEPRIAARWGMVQLNEGGERYLAGLMLARRFPQARVVFAGGSGRLSDLGGIDASEGAMAEALFRSMGLPADRLLIEDRSRNTAENAALSLPLAAPEPGETWVLVTSAFHMPRAMTSFARAGWPDMIAYPVDHRSEPLRGNIRWSLADNLVDLNTAAKEYVGRLAYGLAGR